MELKLVILSLACFSCLVPPALGSSLLAAKAVAAVGAAKGAALLGAGALAAKGLAVKGLALKGAVALGAKVAAVKGAAALGAKALATKAAAVAVAKESVPVVVPASSVVYRPPSLSLILNRLGNLASTVHAAAKDKSLAVGELLLSLLPSKTLVQPPTIVEVPTMVEVPTVVEVPKYVMAPANPSVAVVGPTMNVVYEKPEKLYPVPVVEKIVKK